MPTPSLTKTLTKISAILSGDNPVLLWLFVLLVGCIAVSARAAVISASANNVTGNTWQMAYVFENDIGDPMVGKFAIYYEAGLYENIAILSAPLGWNGLAQEPDPLMFVDGFASFQATLSGIIPDMSLGGFAVQFDYLGADPSVTQPFEVMNPVTSDVIDMGQIQALLIAIAEPKPILLAFFGVLVLMLYRVKFPSR